MVSNNGVKWGSLLRSGKALYLAYDQGLEHGPISDFNTKNVDPLYILKIAKEGKFQGVVFHKGIAEKYYKEIRASKVPLILKLNGKTSLVKGDPISRQLATVAEAKKLGAKAVGFTIYIGSSHESEMFQEFERVQRNAHKSGLPVILWLYPRGGNVKSDTSAESLSYAARVALELGADMVKLKYGGKPKDLSFAVKSAGRTKLVVAGGTKKSETLFFKQVKEIIASGATGLAIGRNVWQHKDPLKFTKKLQSLIWS